jgi:hypothetical protein
MKHTIRSNNQLTVTLLLRLPPPLLRPQAIRLLVFLQILRIGSVWQGQMDGLPPLRMQHQAECVFWKATTIAKLVFTRARESESTLDSRADSFKVNSVSVSWNLGFELDLETAFLKFETAVYNPSVYPGMKLQYSFDTVRVTIIVFKSGKALGIGFKSVACVHDLLVRVRTDIQQKMQEMDNGARTGNRCRSENTDYSHCI